MDECEHVAKNPGRRCQGNLVFLETIALMFLERLHPFFLPDTIKTKIEALK
jgi:hypothetical protein